MKITTNEIPESIKQLLWSYDLSMFDIVKNKKRVVINVVNYGNLNNWCWLIDQYSLDEVKKIIIETPNTEFRPQALSLARLIFGINELSHASRCTH